MWIRGPRGGFSPLKGGGANRSGRIQVRWRVFEIHVGVVAGTEIVIDDQQAGAAPGDAVAESAIDIETQIAGERLAARKAESGQSRDDDARENMRGFHDCGGQGWRAWGESRPGVP